MLNKVNADPLWTPLHICTMFFLHNCFDNQIKQTLKASAMNTVEYLRMEREEGLAEGLARGKEETIRFIVENLLRNSDYPVEKIASSCGVSIEFVHDVKRKMKTW